ncbi:hypothetical protein HPB49_017484 [Dermacentor silvarum]|uniref:Uncharacterized protein n=1 Tax=Dermacentor silvarum TaxID=543639 RepID=A0ACB8DQ76_DERSI|nr:hypothetical protein HPB49_017484 [Dermacentor silvarum]
MSSLKPKKARGGEKAQNDRRRHRPATKAAEQKSTTTAAVEASDLPSTDPAKKASGVDATLKRKAQYAETGTAEAGAAAAVESPTAAVEETVSPLTYGSDQGNATTGQEGAAQFAKSTVSHDAQTTVAAEGTNAPAEVSGSAGTVIRDVEPDKLGDKSASPIRPTLIATGEPTATLERSHEGGTSAEVSPVSREGSMAAAATSGRSPTGLDPEEPTKAPRTMQLLMTAGSPQSMTSLPRATEAPKLDESFYEKIADIRRSPQPTGGKSIVIDGRVSLRMASLCGTLVALVFIIAVLLPRLKRDAGANTCDTSDCLVHASLLKASLNLSVDPCHDFSAFVCSHWSQKQTAFGEDVNSVMDSLRYSWYNNFGDTLRLGSRKLPVGKKPLAMYEMCLSDSSSVAKDVHTALMLSLFLDLPAGWGEIGNKAISALSLAVLFAYRWQAPFWLTVNVLDGRRLSSGRRRVVVKPGAYLPSFLRQHRAAADSYGQYMLSYFTAYLPKADGSPIHLTDSHVSSIRDMEADVLGQLNTVYYQQKPSVFNFDELDAKVAPGFAGSGTWLQHFREALSLEPELTPQDVVLVSHALLFEVLAGLVVKYGDVKLKYLLVWQFVQLYLPLGDLRLLATRYGSKSKADISRPLYCAHHVEASFKVLALSLSIAASFSAEIRDSIDALFDGLVSSALKKVNSSTWLDEESKLRVNNKLAHVKKLMWPPQSLMARDVLEKIYEDVSENETSVAEFWIKTRLIMSDVKAPTDYLEASRRLGNNFLPYIDYDYISNSVEIATGIAAAPAYYRNGTGAMFYGGLGFLMALQVVKSIDEEGLEWAAPETIADTILTSSTQHAYDDRVRCLNKSGAKSIFPEIPALEIAYSALEDSNLLGGQEHLGLSPELPEGKVFFLTICYMTCTPPGHSNPVTTECNKLAQNSEYFAKVYGCPKGSRMNPEKKCSFFS